MVPSCDMSCAAQLETSKLTATLATLYTSVASDDGAAVNISFEVHATRTAHVRVNRASRIGLVCVCVCDGRWRIARIPNGSSCCVVLDSVSQCCLELATRRDTYCAQIRILCAHNFSAYTENSVSSNGDQYSGVRTK